MRIVGNGGKPWTLKKTSGYESLLLQAPASPRLLRSTIEPSKAPKTRAYILRVTLGRFGARRRGLSKWG
jgi:hypothetical protein